MLILNFNFEYVDSFDEITHQIQVPNIPKVKEVLTVHGFTRDQVKDMFCLETRCRVIKDCSINVNTSTGAIHIVKNDDSNIHIIFYEYLQIKFKEKKVSKISLKTPIRMVGSKYNTTADKKAIKYFNIPKSQHFWIKEFSGDFGNKLTCYYWDGNEFRNKGSLDMEEIETDKNKVKPIVSALSTTNIFLADTTCGINTFMKAYPSVYFRYLYDDFWNNIIKKYPQYDVTPIVKVDCDDFEPEKQILKKTKGQIPIYVCLPANDADSEFYEVYEAIKVI